LREERGTRINFQLPRLKDGKEGEGRWAGAAGVPVGACSSREKKGGREEGRDDRWGHRVSSSRKKKKKSGQAGRCGRD
jgi:hypothetical protein